MFGLFGICKVSKKIKNTPGSTEFPGSYKKVYGGVKGENGYNIMTINKITHVYNNKKSCFTKI